MIEISKRYRFEAAHYLPHVAPGHQCKRLHGHSYVMEVALSGTLTQTTGWVMDFGTMTDLMVKPLLEQLDHYCLNDIEGLDNPTAERLAEWLFARLGAVVLNDTMDIARNIQLVYVAVEETQNTRAVCYANHLAGEDRWQASQHGPAGLPAGVGGASPKGTQ